MAVTIRDVARHAGVSVATVSRYLNNSPLIAPDSVEKVRRSIEELHYEPNFLARNMLTKQSQSVALIVDDSSPETFGNENFLRIQYGIEKALAEHGYYLLVISLQKNGLSQNLKKALLEKRADGIILPAQLAGKAMTRFLNEHEIPFVVIGRSAHDSWVDIDNIMGGRIAAEALIKTNAKHLCFVGNGEEKVFVQERQKGFTEAAEAAGISAAVKINCPASQEAGYQLISEEDAIYDGYVVSDNVTAFGLLNALKDRGTAVPAQVQVISFDDDIVSQLCFPSLTVVDIDVQQLGIQAANQLYLQLQSETKLNQQCLLPASLIQRGSSR